MSVNMGSGFEQVDMIGEIISEDEMNDFINAVNDIPTIEEIESEDWNDWYNACMD